jgi:hypothetical protein
MEAQQIPGWGVDKEIRNRPGYPLEQEFHLDHDTMQGQSAWRPTIRTKGLSGKLRAAAYGIPTHKPRRWMLLLLADRIDAFESKLTARNLLLAAGAIGGVTAALLLAVKRRSLR